MKNLFTFKGRANRAKFLLYILLAGVVIAIPEFIALSTKSAIMWGVTFLLYIPYVMLVVCLYVQRLHDIERPGTHYWLLLIPIYNLYLGCLLLFKKGSDGPNYYGEDPLALKEVA